MFNLINTKEQLNKIKNKLSLGVLGVVAAMIPQTAESQERQIEEVVVSATKKDESASKVAVTVTALTEETLKEMNVSNFDEYVQFLPNVSSGGRGPGQSTIYIRGMAVDPVNVFLSAAQGSTPNVALYLDEQPLQVPGRNLDVYVADMERIEVLPGPQGTLYGASSQAGTVRMITNKPKFNVQEGGFNMSHYATAHGDPSYSYDAYMNIPLINDVWSIRGVFYKSEQGGYIDNVAGTWSGEGRGTFASYPQTQAHVVSDNSTLVEDNFNDATYEGFRISSASSIGDDWDMLITHMSQDISADGVFDYDPAKGDLNVSRFVPDTLDDSFSQTSLTLEGRMGKLDALYTGAYLERESEQQVDYSGYANVGAWLPYYVCNYTAYTLCGPATVSVELIDDNQRTTHEFRVSSNDESDLPFSYTAGVFIDESILETENDYCYLGTDHPFASAGTWAAYQVNNPLPGAWSREGRVRRPACRFFNDLKRTEEQTAYFAEVTFPVSDKLDVIVGARKYDLDVDYTGQSKFGYRGSNVANGRDYDVSGDHSTEPLNMNDTITKLSAKYTVDDDTMWYFTRSEGYRPGGFNRGGGLASRNSALPSVLITYGTDDTTNTEIGVKTVMLDGTLRLNASYYMVDWTDVQVSQFDPVNVGLLTFIENAADAEIKGMEADILWYPSDNVTVASAVSYNDTEVTADKSRIIQISNVGSSMPLSPKLQYNIRVKVDSELAGNPAYTQVAVKSADKAYSSLEAAKRLEQPSYTIWDAAYGVNINGTEVEFFVRNITDERANFYYNDQDDIPRITTNRPRNIGVRISYKF